MGKRKKPKPTWTYEGNLAARRQEELHAAYAALTSAGLKVSIYDLKRAANKGAGRYSDISLLGAVSDIFNALNQLRRDDAPGNSR